jgi:cytochrome c peroxidase
MSCSTCHQQQFAVSDGGRRFSTGIDGIAGNRNAPALTNVGFTSFLFWNGRARSLEEQARSPVTNPIEMHTTWPEVVARLQLDADYPERFGLAFGDETISEARIVQAIAQFQRSMVSANSPYDRWRASSQSAPYPAAARRGYFLFFTETGDCFHCHNDFAFSIQEFRDIGLDAVPDSGLARVTGLPLDYGKFKIPTLRNVAVSAPYMHDGRFSTLEEVLEHYDSGGHRSPNLDPLIRFGQGLGLTVEQKSDIIAFLHSLTDSTFLTNVDFSDSSP